MAHRILIVDDEPNVLNALKRALRGEPYEVDIATDGVDAIRMARERPPSVVISDMRMPGLSGVQVLQGVRDIAPDCFRVLLTGYADMGSTIEAINQGQIHRYISKPWNDEELKTILRELIQWQDLREERDRLAKDLEGKNAALAHLNETLEQQVAARTNELEQTNLFLDQAHRELKSQYLSAVKVFSNLVELRQPAMAGHSKRVAELCKYMAEVLELPEHQREDLHIAALLHDIGKLGVPDHVLLNPVTALNGEDRAELMKHPLKGQASLMGLHDLQGAAKIIRHHHERFDGQGFPDGLMKSLIPLPARLLAVAEDYDELQQGWLAEKKLTEQEALQFVQSAAGKRYDPEAVAALEEALKRIPQAERENERLLTSETVKPGARLSRDLVSPKGLLLLSKDHVLTRTVVEQLKEYERHEGVKVRVYVHK